MNAAVIPAKDMEKIKTEIFSVVSDQSESLATVGLDKERFASNIVEAIMRNPDLVLKERTSVLRAIRSCCQDGLVPNGYEAALVPGRDNTVQYRPMVGGLSKIAHHEMGIVIEAGSVTEKDAADGFEIRQQVGKPVEITRTYRFQKADPKNRPEVIGAYCILRIPGEEIERLRVFFHEDIINARGQSTRRSAGGPWETAPRQMAEKSVVKSALNNIRYMRPDSRLAQVLAEDDAAEFGPTTIDMGDLEPEKKKTRKKKGAPVQIEAPVRTPAPPPPEPQAEPDYDTDPLAAPPPEPLAKPDPVSGEDDAAAPFTLPDDEAPSSAEVPVPLANDEL